MLPLSSSTVFVAIVVPCNQLVDLVEPDRLLLAQVSEPLHHRLGRVGGRRGKLVYDDLAAFVRATCEGTTKHPHWGGGFRNRRELVRKALLMLGLSPALQYHGVRREVFVAPLGENTPAFLCGGEEFAATRRSVGDIFEAFRGRWLLPRALRDRRWLDFDPASYRLWSR